ncbi:peptidoglycan binding domain-containing protein, partial [Streptomyces nanshensis]|uniref:peptidoglycan binding domain-containing protein n=1 Tax=Streptomyces nanshensis TaxID=518642 RepID=UPI000A9D036E
GPGAAPGVPGAPGAPGAGGSGPPRGPEETSGGGDKPDVSDWFAPRKGKSSPGTASSGATGTVPVQGPGPSSAPGPGAPPGAAETPYGTNDPYGVGSPYGTGDSYAGGPGDPYDTGSYSPPPADTPAHGTPAGAGLGGPGAVQDGPTTGPVSGDMAMPPPPLRGDVPPEPPANSTLGLGTGRAPFAPGGVGEDLLADGPGGPDGTQDPAATGGLPAYGGPTGYESTAVADEESERDGERVAGETLMSRAPRLADEDGGGISGSPFERAPSRASEERDDASGGGRSKLALVGVGVLGLVGIAYGAGLLLDHADVPNGTTVLGVQIGGMSRHEAVNKLDAAFGDRTTQDFTVVAAGKQAKLKPSVAGMTLDTEATVRAAAGRDYNPVSVIGSLFGMERDAEPALKVDQEKMASALRQVAKQTGVGGAPKDGMVKFVGGKAVGVPGKPHKGIDAQKASARLEGAYRTRAQTGNNSPVRLPVSPQQPQVGKKEIDRAIREFGKPAMSGLVTIKAGGASIQFSPQKSLPKFLSMKPVNGTLVDTYDLPVLKTLYGTTFDGVEITRGNGTKTPVTPQDVAGALRLALKETSPAKRVQEIPTKPQ